MQSRGFDGEVYTLHDLGARPYDWIMLIGFFALAAAALDPKSESQMIDFLVSWRGSGKTVIAATHDLDHIQDIADDCCVLQEGRLAAEGPPAVIVADSPLLERSGLLHSHRHRDSTSGPHFHSHER